VLVGDGSQSIEQLRLHIASGGDGSCTFHTTIGTPQASHSATQQSLVLEPPRRHPVGTHSSQLEVDIETTVGPDRPIMATNLRFGPAIRGLLATPAG
jgi:hypothetical protein